MNEALAGKEGERICIWIMALAATSKKTLKKSDFTLKTCRRERRRFRFFFLSSNIIRGFVLFAEHEQLPTFISSFVFYLFLATFHVATAKFEAIATVTTLVAFSISMQTVHRSRTKIVMIEIIARIRSVYVHVIVA